MSDLNDQINQACADGKLSVDDADEVRRFAGFLTEAGNPGSRQGFEAWRKYYPEDYRQALREAQARKRGGRDE